MKRLGRSSAVLSLGAGGRRLQSPSSHSRRSPGSLRRAQTCAFLVGVEKYSHGKLHDLEFPENDLEELADVLNSQGFKTVLLTTRLGKNDASRMPTQQNVWDGIRTFLKEHKPTRRDLMLVGLAGHGIQPLGSDESYFCPTDADGRSATADLLTLRPARCSANLSLFSLTQESLNQRTDVVRRSVGESACRVGDWRISSDWRSLLAADQQTRS